MTDALTVGFHGTPVHLDRALDERQTDAQAGLRPFQRGIEFVADDPRLFDQSATGV